MHPTEYLEGINSSPRSQEQTPPLVSKTNSDSFPLFKEKIFQPEGPTSCNRPTVTSLQNACRSRDWDRVTQLILTMGCIKIDEEGNTPLHYLVSTAPPQYIDKLSTYLQQHPAEREAKNRKGLTALHTAAIRGDPSISNQLLAFNCDLEAKDDDGNTPVSIACISSNSSIIASLLASKANVNTSNSKAKTPLHIASFRGLPKTVGRLISASANVNAKDSYGCAPLHAAAHNFNVKVIKRLLMGNADATIQNEKDGETPLLRLIDRSRNFDPTHYQLLIEKDSGLTEEILNRTLLAQVFGIKAFTPLGKQEVELEGYPVFKGIIYQKETISTCYQKFIASLEGGENAPRFNLFGKLTPLTCNKAKSLTIEQLREVLDNTERATRLSYPDHPADTIDRILKGFPVGVVVNTAEHSTALAFYSGKVAKCNKGYGCDQWPGVVVHTMGEAKNIEKCLYTCIPNDVSDSYLNLELDKDLDLNPYDKYYLAQKMQKIGNCVIASTNSMELALLFLQLEPLIGHSAAEELARTIQKIRVYHAKMGLLTTYLKNDLASRKYPPDLVLLGKLHKKTSGHPSIDRQVGILIRNWCEQNDVTSQELSLQDDLWSVETRTTGAKRKSESSVNPPQKKSCP